MSGDIQDRTEYIQLLDPQVYIRRGHRRRSLAVHACRDSQSGQKKANYLIHSRKINPSPDPCFTARPNWRLRHSLPYQEYRVAKEQLPVFPETAEERIVRHADHIPAAKIPDPKDQALL